MTSTPLGQPFSKFVADQTLTWFRQRTEFETAVRPGLAARRHVERAMARVPQFLGRCTVCGQDVKFTVPSNNRFGAEPDLREGWHCPECGCNNRQRLLVTAVLDTIRHLPPGRPRVYLAEAFSSLAIHVRGMPWQLSVSDFVSDESVSGQVYSVEGHQVVHQDLTKTSFNDEQFDIVVHAEVLEHVPQWRALLKETARITRPGGYSIFSVPFLQHRNTGLQRATIDLTGRTIHHLPPEVHGAPLHPEGTLVYEIPGWNLLDELVEQGFSVSEIGWLSCPGQGFTSNNSDYDNYMEPVVFRARKD